MSIIWTQISTKVNTLAGYSGRLLGYVTVLYLLATASVRAQAPAWQSLEGPMGAGVAIDQSEITAMSTDASGDVYVTGSFAGTLHLGVFTLLSDGGDNVFVAKWNPTIHDFLWATHLGGLGDDYPQAIAVAGGGVYVAGSFASPALHAGTLALTKAGVPTSNESDVFVVKLTNAGSPVWAQRAGGPDSESVGGLAVVGNALYLTGSYKSPSLALGSATLANAGGSDVFVAKLLDAGPTSTVSWATQAGGPGLDQASGLAVSGSSVYLTGAFTQPAAFGATTLSPGTAGREDLFVAKLTDAGSSGAFAWAMRGGSTARTFARTLAVSGSSVYVAGEFSGATATFGPVVLTNAGSTTSTDLFVAKLTDAGSTGEFDWSMRAGGPGYDNADAVAVQGTAVYLGGHFNGATAAFGSTTLANSGPLGTSDICLARLTDAGSTGRFDWAQVGGSTGSDYCRSLAIRGTSVRVGGSVRVPATFGSQVLVARVGGGLSGVSFFAGLTDATLTAVQPAQPTVGVELFPNPAHGTATVRLSAIAGPATFTILDVLGRTLRTQTATATAKAELDLTGLAPGYYAVRVSVGTSTATQRLMVE